MCLPVGCLKACVGLATIITLALGIIAIVCAATIGTNNLFISSVKETKLVVMYLLVVFGALLILLALTGIIGVCKKSSCCLTLYNLGVIIFFLIFLAVGIAAFASFNHYKVQNIEDYNNCANSNWLKDANEYGVKAQAYLCHSSCACDWTEASNSTSLYNYSLNGSAKLQDCPDFKQTFSNYSDYFIALELIEREFNCAGVCQKAPYYLFTDVNKGTPIQACAPKIQDYLSTYSKRIGAAAIVIAMGLLGIIVCSFCLCCHPKKKQERNVYQRMI